MGLGVEARISGLALGLKKVVVGCGVSGVLGKEEGLEGAAGGPAVVGCLECAQVDAALEMLLRRHL